MTGSLMAALSGALIVAGVLGIIVGATPVPVVAATPARPSILARWRRIPPRTRVLAGVGVAAGVVIASLTGWVVAVVAIPVAAVGLPALLAAPPETARIARLEAMAEWTRNLAGVLTVGVGLEQALTATLRSTPEPIHPEVSRLVARLRARWSTEDALRLFADELDDPTGDLVAAYLILGARRRGSGLESVLQGLAESVGDDVTARRQIEADRAKPRGNARNVTLITVGVLVVLTLNGQFMAPYGTPLGQVILAILLTAYSAALWWMRRMSLGAPMPRFMGSQVREQARS